MATPEAPLREILKSLSFTQFPLCHIDPFYTPAVIPRPQLFVYPSPGITSDVECLRILALLKFASYEFDLRYTNEPNSSPNAQLPYLLLPDGTAIDNQHIEDHLSLGESSMAYYSLAKHGLVPATEYLVWVDPVGVSAFGDRYLGGYSVVVRWALGWVVSERVAKKLQTGMPEYGAALDGDVVYENAVRAMDSLLVFLGDRMFLDGEAPGRLDALVFACLNAFLEAPVKSPVRTLLTLKDSKYRPLVDYVLRIISSYFGEKADSVEPRVA
ncbi:orotate phosphoribosyltransferase [Coemansia sp. S85]|nr:orotate phosphoribosyltransferase [Coemansia sp. S85]